MRTALYLIRLDGPGERRLTRSMGDDSHPDDGGLIVFESSRDGAWNLYTIHPDGTGERRLTHRGSRVSRLQRQRDRRDSATPA